MDPNSKRKFQLIIGFAIFAFAVAISYFSVAEADVQDTPQYDIYLVIDVSGSMENESKLRKIREDIKKYILKQPKAAKQITETIFLQ